jgi:sporulation protein YlmC with PRC-barrel domain
MLRSLKTLEGYHVSATDGGVGKVSDFFVDDQRWVIRYLVVDTGGFWKGPHRVLISPVGFRRVDWSTRTLHLAMTRSKIKGSPSVDAHEPLSRRFEREHFHYYGWSPYWAFGGSMDWGIGLSPSVLASSARSKASEPKEQESGDPHLRSIHELLGYRVEGNDGAIGDVDDFIVDDAAWSIRYLVVDTSNWWFGNKVLVAPRWTDKIGWLERTVYLSLPRETIKHSPQLHANDPVNREYEERLYDYYGRPVYWAADERDDEPAEEVAPTDEHVSP